MVFGICSIIIFQGLFGSSYTNRSKRKNIIKDTLDVVLIHNDYLKKSSYLSNRDKFTKLFGYTSSKSYIIIEFTDCDGFHLSDKFS
jgi:hypothetical protein